MTGRVGGVPLIEQCSNPEVQERLQELAVLVKI